MVDTFSSFEMMGFVFMAHWPEVSVTNCPYYTLQWPNELSLEPGLIQSQVVTFLPYRDPPPSSQSSQFLPVPEKFTSFTEKGWHCCCMCFKFQSVSQVCGFCFLPFTEQGATIMK